MKTTRGIIPEIYNIPENQISEVIRVYRWHVKNGMVFPIEGARSDEELRPYAINSILRLRMRPMQANQIETHNID